MQCNQQKQNTAATGKIFIFTEELETKFLDLYCLPDMAGTGRRQRNPQSQSTLGAQLVMEPTCTLIQSICQIFKILKIIKSVIIIQISPSKAALLPTLKCKILFLVFLQSTLFQATQVLCISKENLIKQGKYWLLFFPVMKND